MRGQFCEKRVTNAENSMFFPKSQFLISMGYTTATRVENIRRLHQPWALTSHLSVIGLPSSTAEKAGNL
jgi:hypothetical protein